MTAPSPGGVQRWDIGNARPIHYADGDWVRYGDIAGVEKELAELRRRFDYHRDWNQQRYNALRKWVDAEVRPLSEEVYCRYYNIVANGAPSPYEGADWTGTLHSATLARDVAVARREEAAKEVARLRKALEVASRVVQSFANAERFEAINEARLDLIDDLHEALRGAAGEVGGE